MGSLVALAKLDMTGRDTLRDIGQLRKEDSGKN
jgi:hypothetical protein